MQGASIPVLIREARNQTQLFLREELDLAKAELSEKAGRYRAAATQLGVGAFVAYAAFLVILGGLGLLLSFVLQSIGLDLLPSRSAGFGGIGLVVIGVGVLLVFKGIKSFSKHPMAPEKTLYTINRIQAISGIQGKASEATSAKPAPPKRKSKDVEADIVATQKRLGSNVQALVQRVSPTHYLGLVVRRAQAHPVRWNMGALLTGFVGSVWFVKKLRR